MAVVELPVSIRSLRPQPFTTVVTVSSEHKVAVFPKTPIAANVPAFVAGPVIGASPEQVPEMAWLSEARR